MRRSHPLALFLISSQEDSLWEVFCGWHFRCQSDHQVLAIIASYHKAAEGSSSEIEIVMDAHNAALEYEY